MRGKTRRATALTDVEKQEINDMSAPQDPGLHSLLSVESMHCIVVPGACSILARHKDMPRDERKRQYAALRRAILKNVNPALSAKFSLCDDGERQAS